MNQEKVRPKNILKNPFFKWFLPVSMTVISLCFWIKFVEFKPLEIVGLITNILGLTMWWVAKLTLSKNWNLGFGKPEINQLVTYGIYSKISHPMYWGIIITFLGLTLIYHRTWFIAVSLLVIIYFLSRMRVENSYLMKVLGEEYKKYKERTWI